MHWFGYFLIKHNIICQNHRWDTGFFPLYTYNCVIYVKIIHYGSGTAILIFGCFSWLVDLGFFWSRFIEQQFEYALRPPIPNPPFYGLEFQSGKIQRKHSQWETAAGEGVVPAAACQAVRKKSEELTLISYWRKGYSFW